MLELMLTFLKIFMKWGIPNKFHRILKAQSFLPKNQIEKKKKIYVCSILIVYNSSIQRSPYMFIRITHTHEMETSNICELTLSLIFTA